MLTRKGISAAVALYLSTAGWSALRAEPQARLLPRAPGARTRVGRADGPRTASAPDNRALLKQVLRHLSQRACEDRGAVARGRRPRERRRQSHQKGDLLEKIVRKVRVGMMPPAGMPRPDDATTHRFVASMESTLDRAAAAQPNVGRPMVHRLNRVEYAYAIQDLLDLEIDPVALLPPDESGYGFDNISDLLGTSPMLLERYLNAAGKLSALAVGDPATVPGNQTFIIRQDRSQDTQIDGMPIGTFGGGLARVTLPLDGEYVINAKLFRTNLGAMRGLELPNQAEFTVDGRRVLLVDLGGEKDHLAHLTNPTVAGDEIDGRLSVRLPLKAGPHVITVGWIRRVAEPPWKLQPFTRSSIDTIDMTGRPHFDRFAITGPFNPTGPGDTPSRRRVFVCRPDGRRAPRTPARAASCPRSGAAPSAAS